MITRNNSYYLRGLMGLAGALILMGVSFYIPAPKQFAIGGLGLLCFFAFTPGIFVFNLRIERDGDVFRVLNDGRPKSFYLQDIRSIKRNKLKAGHTLKLRDGSEIYLPFHLTGIRELMEEHLHANPHAGLDDEARASQRLLKEEEEGLNLVSFTWRDWLYGIFAIPLEGAVVVWLLLSFTKKPEGPDLIPVMYIILLIGTLICLMTGDKILKATDRFLRHFEGAQKFRSTGNYRKILFGLPRLFYIVMAIALATAT